jgi:Flp pilus assembly pilin Flp
VSNSILNLYVKGQTILSGLKDESGQDLVEYALVLILVCLALTAGMGTLAQGINAAMGGVQGKLATYLN